MRFTSHTTSADGITERDFVHDGVPGVLWTPGHDPAGLVLSAHGGGRHKRAPGILARAHRCAAAGLAVVALDAPGHGDRVRTAEDERFAIEIRSRMAAGQDAGALVAEYNALQASRAIPEWRSVLDALPALGDRVGFWGVSMGSALGIPLVAAEPRVRAAVFGLIGATGPLVRAAAAITVPVRFLLQCDDRLVARDAGLALFDAFAAPRKSLHANPGGHGDVPEHELAGAVTFLAG
ncbi:alpha/beta hydrolase [Lentzea flaviverrucosa]|uniref:Lysophospholipase, alpha-beta hydrolase superfamily n=1 Tax=Lentzea flaviverrucosa TaxID=200379 RepID=A0A1H9B422_9PSEU|nr:alpha/beta hydrolase [Lentzea flaviverrucosa]RDI31905.1 alpha-beta hydrolase superfamily lysophospholipase [Lentzea flaviverrucosa]SEP82988.1 Lysophospholipase, alpha-beta hydrolase superfamily [Lentzea flaviverrucosa]